MATMNIKPVIINDPNVVRLFFFWWQQMATRLQSLSPVAK
jgi:hypothetical protein